MATTAPKNMIVLDGGMGHLLRRKGIEVKGEIGSVERFLGVALANLERPQLVQEAHEEYLRAGAQVVTTNSYACVPRVVGDKNRTIAAIREAGRLARAACDKYGGLVAGCIPPLNASYRFDLVGDDEELEREYALIAETIAPYSDVLLCETMSCVREAAVAAKMAAKTGKPVWVSWGLSEDDKSGQLLSGETIEEAVAALDLRYGGPIEACLFNCSRPECLSYCLPRLQTLLPPGVALGGYANGFLTVKSPGGGGGAEYRKDLTPTEYAAWCKSWAQSSGSTILGGCCGIFPEHIAEVARVVSSLSDAPEIQATLHNQKQPLGMHAVAVRSSKL